VTPITAVRPNLRDNGSQTHRSRENAMRKLIVAAFLAAAFVALVSATAIALLGLPQDELVYAMNLDDPSTNLRGVPAPWIPG
jgi:hypothetical protein